MIEALEEAIIRGDVVEVAFLLSSGVGVNKHFHNGSTPLNTAIDNHQTEVQ